MIFKIGLHDFLSACLVLFLSLGAVLEGPFVAVFTKLSKISSSPSSVRLPLAWPNIDLVLSLFCRLHGKVPCKLSTSDMSLPSSCLNSASALSSFVLNLPIYKIMHVRSNRSKNKKGATSVIIFPLVLFLSLWLAFFSNCWITLSLVVRYSKANSETTLQNSFGLVSEIWCKGIPSHNKNLWNLKQKTVAKIVGKVRMKTSYRLIIRLWMIPNKIMRSAQSAKKSDIFTFIIVEPSCFAMSFKWSQDALQSASRCWMLAASSSKSILDALVMAPIYNKF